MNKKQMFGFPMTKAALNASFKTGKDASAEGSRRCNVFWGTNGVISWTSRYWTGGIDTLVSMYSEIDRLSADVGTWRRKAHEEKLKRKAAVKRAKEAGERS